MKEHIYIYILHWVRNNNADGVLDMFIGKIVVFSVRSSRVQPSRAGLALAKRWIVASEKAHCQNCLIFAIVNCIYDLRYIQLSSSKASSIGFTWGYGGEFNGPANVQTFSNVHLGMSVSDMQTKRTSCHQLPLGRILVFFFLKVAMS